MTQSCSRLHKDDVSKQKRGDHYRGYDAIGLALPVRDVAVGLDDDVTCLTGGLGPHQLRH